MVWTGRTVALVPGRVRQAVSQFGSSARREGERESERECVCLDLLYCYFNLGRTEIHETDRGCIGSNSVDGLFHQAMLSFLITLASGASAFSIANHALPTSSSAASTASRVPQITALAEFSDVATTIASAHATLPPGFEGFAQPAHKSFSHYLMNAAGAYVILNVVSSSARALLLPSRTLHPRSWSRPQSRALDGSRPTCASRCRR